MFCSECGKQLEDNVLFCDNCGTRIEENENGVEGVVETKREDVKVKNCIRCGNEMSLEEKFCGKCGSDQKSDISIKVPLQETASKVHKTSTKDMQWITPDEEVVASLGNSYGVNMLFGDTKKCNAVLTNKRLYLGGALYTGNNDMLTKVNMEQIIDVEDITGTGFVYSKVSKWMVVLGILTLPTIIIGLILLIKAFMGRTTFFFVEYAGGSIKFDAHLVGFADVKDFHLQIRRVKDQLKRQGE